MAAASVWRLPQNSQRLAHALGLAGAGVDHVGGSRQLTGKHLDEAQLADKRVRNGLEHIGAGGRGGVGRDLDRLAVGRFGHGGGGVGRGQQLAQVVHEHIQRLLVDRAAAEHRRDLAGAHTGGHTGHDLLGREGLALKELFHQGFVRLGDGFVHGLDQTLEPVADVGQVDLDLLAAFIFKSLLAEQVDVGDGAVVQAHGHDAGADRRTEFDLHLLEDLEVIGVFKVGLGDKDQAGLVVLDREVVSLFGGRR